MPTGLWRADAATGVAELVFDGSADGTPMQVAYPHPMPDGQVALFLAPTTPLPPQAGEGTPPSFTMYRVASDGSGDPVAVRHDHHPIRQVLWAPDGSGAVVEVETAGSAPGDHPASRLLWLRADGGAAVELPAQGYAPGGTIQWASSSST
ncbi:MAG: hypothetical protein HC884_04415 [Chloroflexaceae bacterium]|nr:hypothetical protein [Chloroflexaceae bacterium]